MNRREFLQRTAATALATGTGTLAVAPANPLPLLVGGWQRRIAPSGFPEQPLERALDHTREEPVDPELRKCFRDFFKAQEERDSRPSQFRQLFAKWQASRTTQ